ncbi:MAG: hypothetical protein AB8B55_04885 [Mariniblastus sp.]
MSQQRAYILCRFANDSGIYSSWMDDCSYPTTVIDESLIDWPIPDDAGILITHMHYRWEELTTLRKVLDRNNVPILILSDGILEYRNTWEHPGLVDGSIFQPLFGHKLACIGRGQARVVESWGNPGRCEIVGLPRFDSVDAAAIAPVQTTGPFRILIATANTPAFDDQQRSTVVKSLQSIQTWLKSNPTVNGRAIEVTWRLSDGLDVEIGLAEDSPAKDEDEPDDRSPIGEVIESVDAVITTPSTMYLESVMRKRPTALLDFHNSPHYVTAAWTINAAGQLDWLIGELESPPEHKMMFQEFVLADQLECLTPAKPRMFQLIDAMVAEGVAARKEKRPLAFPPRILDDAQHGFATVPAGFDLASLYANNEVFQQQEIQRLQVELDAAIKRLGQLPNELGEKNRYIAKLNRTLDRSRDRVEEMHNRVVAIRKRFGVGE